MHKINKWDFTKFEPITEDYLESIDCTMDQADNISIQIYSEIKQVSRHYRNNCHLNKFYRDYFKRLRSYMNQLENDYDIACAFAWKQYKKGNF